MMDKEKTAAKYLPLVHKIANQFYKKTPIDNDEILGSALEGLADAINSYQEDKGQNFSQYAAYQIRYSILNFINNAGYPIKLSVYNQKKQKENGGSINIFESLNSYIRYNEDGDEMINYNKLPEMVYEDDIVGQIDKKLIIKNIIKDIYKNFNKRDCDIFLRFNGIGKIPEKGTDIARKYNISSTSVSLINKKITDFVMAQQYI